MDSSHETIISDQLSRYKSRRTQRYASVNALLITWKDDTIGVAGEVDELARVFRDLFNFFVWPYQIPSHNAQAELQLHVAQFIQRCGSDDDSLIILFYSGHGGRTADRTSSECVWSAQAQGGPSLDWAIIQPLFLGATCDVAILLDCCFAGQAVRARLQHNVEFLAATDKDQFTPTGQVPDRPSFTKMLTQELVLGVRDSGYITISELHRRLLSIEVRLVKQPFYAVLSSIPSGTGIRLAKWELIDTPTASTELNSGMSPQRENAAALYIRLSLFHPLDATKRERIVRWLTRDSPSDLENVQVLHQAVTEAQAVGRDVSEILHPDFARPSGSAPPRFSDDARDEARRLSRALTDALTIPESSHFAELDISQVIRDISERSKQLLDFLSDSLGGLNDETLASLQNQNLNRTRDLASRIAMRRTMVQKEISGDAIKVYFDQVAPLDSRLWTGIKDGNTVLVEYWEYEATQKKDIENVSKQTARVSALLAEDKDIAFRILPGLGYLQETNRQRIGFVYRLPPGVSTNDCWTLSELIATVKIVPLEIRTRLASLICDAVLHLHSIGWFHKSIKSENILILRNLERDTSMGEDYQRHNFGEPYMIGFDCSRAITEESFFTVDFSMKANIYRHPDRWGRPKKFQRKHDIYALGVLLLEIGCWRLLPSMDGSRKDFETVKNPEDLRDTLLSIARTKLAHSAGSRYKEATQFCLERREWKEDEPWQAQRLVRQNVWQRLVTGT